MEPSHGARPRRMESARFQDLTHSRRLSTELLTHSYPQRIDDGATVHVRAVIALDQEWNAARSFEMARPREGIIENRELLEQQLRFLKRGQIGRALGATVDTVVHRKPFLGLATHPHHSN